MNRKDFEGAIAHGDAWRYFATEWMASIQEEDRLAAWKWFLKGWLSKAKQQDQLKGRR